MNKRLDIKKFASKLLTISLTNELLDEQKISAILKILPKNTDTLLILREYYRLIKYAAVRENLLIYSDGEVSNSQKDVLIEHFERKTGHKLRAQIKKDPTLIAGIRVQLGDKIFEHSIRSTLRSLAQ